MFGSFMSSCLKLLLLYFSVSFCGLNTLIQNICAVLTTFVVSFLLAAEGAPKRTCFSLLEAKLN